MGQRRSRSLERVDCSELLAGVPVLEAAPQRRGRFSEYFSDDDLAVIAGIGEGLLIAGHPGGEHRLAERLADRTERRPGVDAPVLEDEDGLLLGHALSPV